MADDDIRQSSLAAIKEMRAKGLTKVAEKLSALRTVEYFRERAARANLAEADAILDSFGGDEPPQEGDELVAPPRSNP